MQHYELLMMVKNFLIFIAGISLGMLVVLLILSFYLQKAKYIEGDTDVMSTTGEDPKRLIIPLKPRSFLVVFDVLTNVVTYHLFNHKLKTRVLAERNGKRKLAFCVVLVVLLIGYAGYQTFKINGNYITVHHLKDIGIDDDCIKKLMQNENITIKED